MKLKDLTRLLILSIILYSCQKEYSVESGGLTPSSPFPTADSDYIHKIYVIDSSFSGPDSSDLWTYFYDTQKRVTELTDTTNLSLTGGPARWLDRKFQYFYNGTDTLPYKTIETETKFVSSFTYTREIWHYYNSTGEKIKDSIKMVSPVPAGFPDRIVSNYTYTGSNIYGYTTKKTGGVLLSIEYDTATINSAGDLVSNIKHRKDPVLNNTFDTARSVFTYDNKPSPFARLSNFNTYPVFPFGETQYFDFVQGNNRLYANELTRGLNPHLFDDDDRTGKYFYNAHNYPTLIRMPDPLSPPDVYIVQFFYKAL